MKLQASSAFEPEACNLKSLITPETDSCSVAYALFTADFVVREEFRSHWMDWTIGRVEVIEFAGFGLCSAISLQFRF